MYQRHNNYYYLVLWCNVGTPRNSFHQLIFFDAINNLLRAAGIEFKLLNQSLQVLKVAHRQVGSQVWELHLLVSQRKFHEVLSIN